MKREDSEEQAFHKLKVQGVRSLWDTFYWINDALERHLREFRALPDVAAELTSGEWGPQIGLLEGLERLRKDAARLERATRACRWNGPCDDDALSEDEHASLARLIGQFDSVERRMSEVRAGLEEHVNVLLSDPSEQMADYEIEMEASFHLRKEDPGYSDDSDNIIAVSNMSFQFGEEAWEAWDEALPFPHSDLAHQVRLYGGYERGRVDYRDLLRIGSIWFDIVVTHQFCYDLREEKWVNWSARAGSAARCGEEA